MEYTISELYVYPVKSLAGISCSSAVLTEIGFDFDRYWMLVDDHGKFITQRTFPELALFQTELTNEQLIIKYASQTLKINKAYTNLASIDCMIWGESVAALKENESVSLWFSAILGDKVHLVRKAPTQPRLVKNNLEVAVNFPDSNQYLIFGENALNHLNSKLKEPVLINRFRPNIVFSGGEPHIEDKWRQIEIGNVCFDVTKSCARCKITTINQQTGEVGLEPLRTLSTYRKEGKKILFGRYLKWTKPETSTIHVGDILKVIHE